MARFEKIVEEIAGIGQKQHAKMIVEHARQNLPFAGKTIRDLPALSPVKRRCGIVISAGPSVHKRESIKRIIAAGFPGTIIAVDGAYIACLKQGLIPDFVLTLDPHPKRIVRWFGDPDMEENTKNDDYFKRQDLDVQFRKDTAGQNQQHIQLVNKYGFKSKAIVASTAPQNVVQRIREAKFDTYWWNPLVDDPKVSGSLTRQLYDINKFPCMNTGGTVGTAAWVFAHSILKLEMVAVVGMDLGYYTDIPYEKTQTYYELIKHVGSDDIKDCFQEMTFPLTGEKFLTDPTYSWYRRNFLQLLERSGSKVYNCTEGGTLFGENIDCAALDQFMTMAAGSTVAARTR